MSLADKEIPEQKRVKCSWKVLNERRLEDALTFEAIEDTAQKRSLEYMVSLETCVNLGIENQHVPCLLELNVKNERLKIKEISIVSEARIIEIYGKCGEYLATSHAEFFDECEDMVVYIADFEFSQPTPECSIKFARMKSKNQMWLYGIYVCTEKDRVPPDSSVNFNNVNKILRESSHQITDKAEKCKKFLQMYSSYCVSSTSQNLPNPQALLKMFDSVYMTQCSSVGSQAKNVSKCLSELFPGWTSFYKSKCDSDCEHESDDGAAAVTTADADERTPNKEGDELVKFIFDELRQHIDRRFNELAISLTCQVDRRLSELQEQQNKKLDEIVNLLQNMKER